jgi:thiol-disulfide isomerase/thioredoxin
MILGLAAAGVLGAKPKVEMPAFRAKSMTGERLDKSALHGKKVLIQMWATWCGYCRREEPIVEALAEEFGPKGLIVLAANVGESRKKVEEYLKQHPRAHSKIVLNDDTNLPAMIGARGYPFYVMMDEGGMVVDVQAGAGGEPALRELLGAAGLRAAE